MTVNRLDKISVKFASGEILNKSEMDTVVSTEDLLSLGALADARRRKRHGDRVTFVRVCEVPLADRFDLPVRKIPAGAGEVRLVGNPKDGASAIAATNWIIGAAGSIPLTGFALDDLAESCDGDAVALSELLKELKGAGLSGIAEARMDRLSDPELMVLAAGSGLAVGRLTVAEANGVALSRQVADWGSALDGVRAIAPLSRTTKGTTGYCDLRQVALARLLIDNIDSIQVDWNLYGPKLAQVALTFGVDDLDAVSPSDSDEQGWRRSPLEEVKRNILAASLVPLERNGRFELR